MSESCQLQGVARSWNASKEELNLPEFEASRQCCSSEILMRASLRDNSNFSIETVNTSRLTAREFFNSFLYKILVDSRKISTLRSMIQYALSILWLSGDVIELLIYHQPGVKPSLTLRPFGVLGYVAGYSITVATPMLFDILDIAHYYAVKFWR